MAQRLPSTMLNTPYSELMNYLGYFSRREKTMMAQNVLTKGSKNGFIPFGDKFIPRPGSTTYGQEYTTLENVGTIGHYEKYKNLAGIEMEVKAFRSDDNDLNDVVQVEYNGQYIPITENPNPISRGAGRIYFSVYYDASLDPSVSKNLARLVWVDGYEDPTTKKGRVMSWTGGIAVVDSVTGTDILLPTGTTWRSLGFTENANGDAFVVINGTAYELDDTADLNTNSINVTDTTGITAGDIATSQVEVDVLNFVADMCKKTNGYMYYGNFKEQRFWQSNAYARPSTIQITGSNAAQNDLIISDLANYTGSGQNTFTLTVKDIHPEIDTEIQDFYGTGTNNSYFDTTGYTGGTGLRKYRMAIITDSVITRVGGSVVGTFSIGEMLVGQTSGAVFKIVLDPNATGGAVGTEYISGSPVLGEQFMGLVGGGTFDLLAVSFYNNAQLFRQIGNGTWEQITGLVGQDSWPPVEGVFQMSGVSFDYPLTDGLVFYITSVGGNKVGDYYELTIEKSPADPDEFVWQENNGTVSSQIDMSESDVSITDGLEVRWVDDMGHKIGDYWTIQVNQEIKRAWATEYYTLDVATQQSIRRPGEGYIYKMPSNYWTMDTYEDTLYINHANGEWGRIKTQLSADLKSETVEYQSVKQAGANKVLYPYLTGHKSNDLIFINQDKELISFGRLQLIQGVQTSNMSADVQNDFAEASFINGSIQFQDDKIWLTSPNEFVMFCFDDNRGYWQPPQYIPENAMLSTVGNQLISHSSVTNITKKINDPDAEGDDGAKYEVVMRSGAYDYGDRWSKKDANQTFFEGYIYELTPMKLKVHLDVDEPHRTREHYIEPVFGTENPITAVFSGGTHGSHSFASSGEIMTPYAREIYTKLGVVTFYFASLEFSCDSVKHKYEILSLGLNIINSKSNNKGWVPRNESDVDNLLPIMP